MQKIDLQPSYVLHTRSYQETSLLLEVFTQDTGRLTFVAKGAERPRSPLRGLLQPFRPLLLTGQGRGELLTLTGAEHIRLLPQLLGRRLLGGFYLNELLMRLLARNDPHSELYEIYENTLIKLAHEDEQITLRLFEKALLENLGYGLQLVHIAESKHSIDPNKFYLFDPEKGPISVENDQQRDANRLLFKGKSLLALASGNLQENDVLQDAKRLMRQALSLHLGPKPLETRRLLI